jgi:hypothetical protein
MAIELCSALSCSVYTMRGKLRSRVAHRALFRFGFQVFPRLDGTGPDHPAALVRRRRTRHRHGCTAVDRARLSSTRAAVAKARSSKAVWRSWRWSFRAALLFFYRGCQSAPNLTPDRLPLYVSIEFATAARSCACGLRPRGRDPAWWIGKSRQP